MGREKELALKTGQYIARLNRLHSKYVGDSPSITKMYRVFLNKCEKF